MQILIGVNGYKDKAKLISGYKHFSFWHRVSLCSLGRPETCYIDNASLKLIEILLYLFQSAGIRGTQYLAYHWLQMSYFLAHGLFAISCYQVAFRGQDHLGLQKAKQEKHFCTKTSFCKAPWNSTDIQSLISKRPLSLVQSDNAPSFSHKLMSQLQW